MTGQTSIDSSTDSLPLRVIVDDEPASGCWNMAVDEVLLESALADGRCSLRWYRWSQPTLSLGHFQQVGDPSIDERFSGIAWVRRLSGGGAILHDRELTYSCAIGPGHPLASQPTQLYSRIHAAIVGVLSEFGVAVRPRGETNRELDANFLCFSRGDANDLVIGQHKVLGSAQRRRRGAVLQHGSLLLETSSLAPEFPGLSDLVSNEIPPHQVLERLVRATADVLGPSPESAGLTQRERSRANDVMQAAPALNPRGNQSPVGNECPQKTNN